MGGVCGRCVVIMIIGYGDIGGLLCVGRSM